MTYTKKRVIIIAKTYPNLSQKYEETVCVAGIDMETGDWIRMFPIAFRKLPYSKQFKKFDIIEVEAEPYNDKYTRVENHRVKDKTINIIEYKTVPDWQSRKNILLPKLVNSVEELEVSRDASHRTLGLIKPKEIINFYKKDIDACRDWEKDLIEGTQRQLFGNYTSPLEKIPYWMGYNFLCNGATCGGHNMMCEDWETIELFRTMKHKFNNEIGFSKTRDKMFDWMQQRDTYFVVGTESRWNNFLIVSVFYPPFV
ncbi:MAG: hypothetical protein LVQ95_01185 [Candidatus Micrarchaeales archaeon]|nr:hypothetical protein [Candidatus Micrarchaeales archaeon]